MDNGVTDTNSYKKDALIAVAKRDELGADREKDSESNSLLPPRRGGMSKKPQKLRRKVQWNDRNGNKLVEILEFQPSEGSDSDEEDPDSCICTIM